MAPYKFIIAYDGTDYQGFQRQGIKPTVQKEIEDALKNLGWIGTSITYAGRTDAGVHALGQVIGFSLDWKHSIASLQNALNTRLRKSIVFRSGCIAEDDFHPRYDAKSRMYAYHFYCEEMDNPLLDRFAWRVWPEPDYALLEEGAKAFIGLHDFHFFGKPPKKKGFTIREIYKSTLKIAKDKKRFIYKVSANAFLYHMVRRIVFSLLNVGKRKIDLGEITKALQLRENRILPGIAPAKGLILEEVVY